MKLFDLILGIFNVFFKAAEIRQNEELRKKSVRFAAEAIGYSIAAVIFTVVGGVLFGLKDTSILYIFILVIALVFLVSVPVSIIAALLRVIVQFTINRRAASWIALIVFIVCVVASALVAVYFFNVL